MFGGPAEPTEVENLATMELQRLRGVQLKNGKPWHMRFQPHFHDPWPMLAHSKALRETQTRLVPRAALLCFADSFARPQTARVERGIGARPPIAGSVSRQSALPLAWIQAELSRLCGLPQCSHGIIFRSVLFWLYAGLVFLKPGRADRRIGYGPVHASSVDMGHFGTFLYLGEAFVEDVTGVFPLWSRASECCA